MIRRLWSALGLLFWLAVTAVAAEGLTVTGGFTCLWWSPEQMEALDPNHPPPKETRVEITRWEYSDPVGVPHPGTVTFTAILTATADRTAEVEVRTQWLTKVWSSPESALNQRSVLQAGKPMTVSVDIPVADQILKRHATKLRVSVLADGKVAMVEYLPVVVGD